MTATTIKTDGHRPRPLLPLANVMLAGAALTVSLVAITTDNDPAASNVVARTPAATSSATGDCLARAVIVRC